MERFCATMSGSECAKPRSNLVPVDNLVRASILREVGPERFVSLESH